MEIFYTDDQFIKDGVSHPGIPFLLDASMRELLVINKYLYYVSVDRKGSPDTRRTYAADLSDFFSFLEEKRIPWDRVTGDQIVAWRDAKPETRKSPLQDSTINQRICAAGRFYDWAVQKKYLAVNPFGTRLVVRPRGIGASEKRVFPAYAYSLRVFPKRPRFLLQEELDAFVGAITSKRDALIVWLMRETGMRRTEATQMGLGVVPALNGITKRPTLLMTLDPKLTTTKGKKERTVEISKDLAVFLWGYIDGEREVLAFGYRLRHGKNPPDRVFLGRTGAPLSRGHLDKVFKEVSGRCGLGRPITPHMIRHTFATYELIAALEDGMTREEALECVQEKMGHSSYLTTRRYLHLAKLASRKTMDKHQERVTALFKGKLNG